MAIRRELRRTLGSKAEIWVGFDERIVVVVVMPAVGLPSRLRVRCLICFTACIPECLDADLLRRSADDPSEMLVPLGDGALRCMGLLGKARLSRRARRKELRCGEVT